VNSACCSRDLVTALSLAGSQQCCAALMEHSTQADGHGLQIVPQSLWDIIVIVIDRMSLLIILHNEDTVRLPVPFLRIVLLSWSSKIALDLNCNLPSPQVEDMNFRGSLGES